MTPKLKKIILIIVAIGILFFVYTGFIKKDPQIDPLISGNSFESTGDAQILGAQITQALLRIEQITLDKKIFQDPIYQSLEDRTKTIETVPKGRANPFAPINEITAFSISRIATTTNATSTTPVTPNSN